MSAHLKYNTFSTICSFIKFYFLQYFFCNNNTICHCDSISAEGVHPALLGSKSSYLEINDKLVQVQLNLHQGYSLHSLLPHLVFPSFPSLHFARWRFVQISYVISFIIYKCGCRLGGEGRVTTHISRKGSRTS